MRILFITPYVPSLLRTRPRGFIRALAARGHEVALVAAASSRQEANDAEELRDVCAAISVTRIPFARSLWNCATGLAGDAPLQAVYTHSPAFEAAADEQVRQGRFDVVHIEHLRAARVGLGLAGVPRVFDAVDCITTLFAHAATQAPTLAGRWRARLELPRTRTFESRLLRRFASVVVSSERDRRALLALAAPEAGAPSLTLPRRPGEGVRTADAQVIGNLVSTSDVLTSARGVQTADVQAIGNGVDLTYFAARDQPRDGEEIVFVGRMSYHANVAAAVHLVEQVMPLVWRERPSTRVALVGAGPTRRVRALARSEPRVTVTGAVDDVRPWLTRAAVAACPLVYAVGIQNKVLEAMACGTPVVTSAAARESLGARPGEHLLEADGAPAFATALLRLLGDPELRRTLGAGGRAYVEAEHDWQKAAARLEDAYCAAISRPD